MQTFWISSAEGTAAMTVPDPEVDLVPGVRWGAVDEFFTPAFWKCQAELHLRKGEYTTHRLGANLREELAACLLGGYGIPAEMGLLAFHRLKEADLLDGAADEAEVRESLSQPFVVSGRHRRYRFHAQKAAHLHGSLLGLEGLDTDCGDVALRDLLMRLPGVGPKTASWIVRNHRSSDEVAILDIHILRAGRLMGLFAPNSDVARRYFDLEAAFLSFCGALDVRASVLDAMIWDYMRRIGPTSGSGRKRR